VTDEFATSIYFRCFPKTVGMKEYLGSKYWRLARGPLNRRITRNIKDIIEFKIELEAVFRG
jgi:hypothetical protein